MMYAKLALRNVRRTARDYLIYVVTLVLSVGMFYGFFSLVSPYYNATLPVPIHLDVLKKMMRIAVPLVGLFVVFLMSYVNSYMLRRKQKEFAIETIIGMEQKTVAFLFFLETSVMGAAAILLGVLLGMLLSQIISVIVVQSFGENYQLHLSLFPDTFLGTVIFFGAIVLLLGIKNLFAVRKLKIIQMLQNSQKGVENIPLTRQVGKWVVVCTAVSTVILGMMAALSCLVLHYPAALFRVLFLTFLAAGFLVSAVFFFLAGRKKRYEFAKQFEENMGTYQRELGNFPPESAFIRLNTLQSNEGISNMLLLSLIGTYAALVLLVSSFTMLSVQQLTDAIEQKHRFDIIRKLGVERKECQKTARRQMYFWFGLPVLTAIVGSIGVFSYLLWSNYNEIIAYVLPSQIGIILTLSYISFIIVFGCYFVSTYYLFQRNIEKH